MGHPYNSYSIHLINSLLASSHLWSGQFLAKIVEIFNRRDNLTMSHTDLFDLDPSSKYLHFLSKKIKTPLVVCIFFLSNSEVSTIWLERKNRIFKSRELCWKIVLGPNRDSLWVSQLQDIKYLSVSTISRSWNSLLLWFLFDNLLVFGGMLYLIFLFQC